MPTPSLIIPSAPVYDEGNLYGLNVYGTNFVPEPIPFTRATTATRTNAAGLIELAPYNLVQYSEQFENAAWTKSNAGTGVLPLVVANQGTAPDGTLTADRIQLNRGSGGTVSDSSVVRQQITVANNATTTISIYLKSFDGNNYQIVFSNSGVVVSQKITVTNQWQRFLLTGVSAGAAANIEIQLREGVFSITGQSVTADLLVWGAQLVEGTEALPYQQTITRLNRPRVDFSLGGCPNILLEPQRTNLQPQSNGFLSIWTKEEVTTSVGESTLISGQTTTLVTETAINSVHRLLPTTSASLVSGTVYTISFYAKSNGTRNVGIRTGITGTSQNVIFNPNTQTAVSTPAGFTTKITAANSGYYRYEITATSAVTLDTCSICMFNGTLISYLGTSESLYISAFQYEAGAYATSYIPTTTTSVTRNADSFTESNVFSRGMITAAGGTWFVELRNNRALVRDTIANGNALFISDSAVLFTTNSICIHNPMNTSEFIAVFLRNNSVSQTIYTTNAANIKLAIKWNGATIDVFANGVKVVSNHPFAATLLNFLNGGGGDVPKYIQQMALYPTPLSDDELEEMTGLGFNTYPLMANYYNYITQ